MYLKILLSDDGAEGPYWGTEGLGDRRTEGLGNWGTEGLRDWGTGGLRD